MASCYMLYAICVLHRCCKGSSRLFQWCQLQGCFKEVSMVFQGCHTCVMRFFQGCFIGVGIGEAWVCKGVVRVLQNSVPMVLQECYLDLKRLLQRCDKSFIWVLHRFIQQLFPILVTRM